MKIDRVLSIAFSAIALAGLLACNKPQNAPPADNGSAVTQDANAMATNDISNGSTTAPATTR